MMDGGEYEPWFRPTLERVVATALVALWVLIAYQEFGVVLAIRTGLFYVIVLSFIWIPDIIGRLEIKGRNRDSGASGPVSPKILRWVGWGLILGLPAVWFLLSVGFNITASQAL